MTAKTWVGGQVRFVESVSDATHLFSEEEPFPIVVIPVYDAFDEVVSCFRSVLKHSPKSTDILVIDDCGPDRRFPDLLRRSLIPQGHNVVVYRTPSNGGFIKAANFAFRTWARRDIVLLNSDVEVGPQWLDRMTAAAKSSNLIATVSALTNNGTILSCPMRNQPNEAPVGGLNIEEAASRVAVSSLQLRPTIPTAVGHCLFINRAALNVVGFFDESFGMGYGEEVDFSQRAVVAGFRNVCADDVFVYHVGRASFGVQGESLQQRNEATIASRYPFYHPLVRRVADDDFSPLARVLEAARRALSGTKFGYDATSLGSTRTGTALHTEQLLRAFAESSIDSSLTVFVRGKTPAELDDLISRFDHIDLVSVPGYPNEIPANRVDVVFRPFQITDLSELRWLKTVGERVVVAQQDVIAFRNPVYFRNCTEWQSAQDLTRLVLATIDGVATVSESGLAELSAEGLLSGSVLYKPILSGSDHGSRNESSTEIPSRMRAHLGTSFMLLLGAQFAHKNRPFALRILSEVRQRGWKGLLVFAGPLPSHGDSRHLESSLYLDEPDLQQAVVDLGSVTEGEKAWLLENASLCLFPTVVEGFGHIPFEAANSGTPCLSSRQASLAEILPSDLETIEVFDIEIASDIAWRLLHDMDQAQRNVVQIRNRAEDFSWLRAGEELRHFLDEVLTRPRNATVAIGGESARVLALSSSMFSGQRGSFEQFARRMSRTSLIRRLFPDQSRRQRIARRVIERLT